MLYCTHIPPFDLFKPMYVHHVLRSMIACLAIKRRNCGCTVHYSLIRSSRLSVQIITFRLNGRVSLRNAKQVTLQILFV